VSELSRHALAGKLSIGEGKYSDSDLAVDLPDKLAARKETLAMCIDLEPSVLRGM